MFRFIITVLLVLVSLLHYGQSAFVESESLHDTIIIQNSYRKGARHSNIDSALTLVNYGLKLAASRRDPEYLIAGYRAICWIYTGRGEFEKAIDELKKCVTELESFPASADIGSIHAKIAQTYSLLGNLDSSMLYVRRTIPYLDLIKNKSVLARTYESLALSFQQFDLPDMALPYYLKQIEVIKSDKNVAKNSGPLSYALLSIGEMYTQQKNIEYAEQYLLEALEVGQIIPSPSVLIQTYLCFAKVASLKGEDNRELQMLKSADSVAHNLNSPPLIFMVDLEMAKFLNSRSQFSEALSMINENIKSAKEIGFSKLMNEGLLLKADILQNLGFDLEAKNVLLEQIELSGQTDDLENQLEGLDALSKVLYKLKEYRQAYELVSSLNIKKDSISNRSHEYKIDALLSEQMVRELQLDKKNKELILNSKDLNIRLMNEKLARQKIWIVVILTVLLLGSIFARYFYQNRKNKILLTKKNELQAEKLKATELNNELMSLRLVALRCQMNPHFLFNTLTSIQGLILQSEQKEAFNYLGKYSKLVRSILNFSKQDYVKLAEELELLKEYVDLEKLIRVYDFNVSFYVDSDINEEDIWVPALILQPHLENAIIHGISKVNDGQIDVHVFGKGEMLYCEIIDNGIGRTKAANSQIANQHNSIAVENTRDRLHKMTNLDRDNVIRYEDLFDDNNNPTGTKVKILISANYNVLTA